MSKKRRLKSLFQSKISLIVLIVILLFSLISLSNELARRVKIAKEIERQKDKITQLELERSNLSSVIELMVDDTYIEEEARKKLGLQKPGETLIIVDESSVRDDSSSEYRSNVSLWFEYFF